MYSFFCLVKRVINKLEQDLVDTRQIVVGQLDI